MMMSASAFALEVPHELNGKTVTVVLGYAAGGANDVVLRKVLETTSSKTNITFVVLNKPGAGGILAEHHVINNKPDGLTLTYFGSDPILNFLMDIPNAPPIDSFVPIISVMELCLSPVVKKGDIKTLKDLVKYSKTNPNSMNYSTATVITTLLTEHLLESLKINNSVPINYKAAPQMVSAVLTNEVILTLSSNWQPMVAGNQLEILAYGCRERRSDYPNVLTLREQGHNIELTEFVGFFAHKDTPQHIVEFYNKLFAEALKDPELTSFLNKRNGKVLGGNLSQAKDTYSKYSKLRETMYKKYKERIKD